MTDDDEGRARTSADEVPTASETPPDRRSADRRYADRRSADRRYADRRYADRRYARSGFRTLALLGTVAGLFLKPLLGVLAISLCTVLWWTARPQPRRQARWIVGPGLLVVIILLALAAVNEHRTDLLDAARVDELEAGYGQLWDELESATEEAVETLGQPPSPAASDADTTQLRTFERLQQLVGDHQAGLTLFFLDPNGEAFAWAGEGLLHEPRWSRLPAQGLAYRHGYTAVTFYAIAPLGDPRRPWRVVAGRSLPTDRLPMASSPWPRAVRWSVGPSDVTAPPGRLALRHGTAPAMLVEIPAPERSPAVRLARDLHGLAAAFLGLTLIVLAATRMLGDRTAALPQQRPPRQRQTATVAWTAMAGALAWAVAAAAPGPLMLSLVGAVGAVAWGLPRHRQDGTGLDGAGQDSAEGRLDRLVGPVFGALTPWLIWLWALFQNQRTNVDLALGFAGESEILVLRLTGCLAAVGLFALAPRRRSRLDDRPAWLAVGLLLVAAAVLEAGILALPLLSLAGVAIVRWLSGFDLLRRPAALAMLLLCAALTAAVAWETAYRQTFRDHLHGDVLPLLGPPSALEVNRLHLEPFDFFEGLDVGAFRPPRAADVDPQDLAFVLWRSSPLAHRDGLSALVIEALDGETSTFSFGLSLDDNRDLIWEPTLWQIPQVAPWQDALALGEAWLTLDGRPWGTARYWLVPRPGFRLEVSEIEELEAALLGGKPRRRGIDGLPKGVLHALYAENGRAISSPWEEAPPLAADDLRADGDVLETPDGPCWAWSHRDDDGITVLYLPRLTLRAALERVGLHALGALLLVVGMAVLALVFALPRVAFSDAAARTVRSYSKRLILVYTLLLILPLVALNLLLMNGFEERLREEQLARGEDALSSARLFVLDFIRGIEPGFGIDTRVNRELLEWISNNVQHQVNFYWSNQVIASSQQELFTAGLLARRIPGDVFSRLALLGYELGSRTQHSGKFAYRELYAPLKMQGAIDARQGIFLSVPLLEQEEEVGRELATMKRRAVLITTALLLLLLAVGSRLARSFTRPLMELVQGTREIAAGATELEARPRELELEALAEAIDEMARRIAFGRERLLREKQVVEGMVENITSGVVSLDRERRVVMHNRVAAEMLGTEVGEALETALEGRAALAPVLDFLRRSGPASRQAAIRIPSEDDEEGGGREWTLTWVPLPGSDDPATILVVDDATEVLRGQRLEAWAEMARIIAHEIKNPLTPIRLSAEHLRQVYAADRDRLDEVFERCTANILSQVEELRELASDFSIYSRIPRADPRPGDLVALLSELAATYQDAPSHGVTVTFSSSHEKLDAAFDPKLLSRAVRNLLENAVRAGGEGGRVELSVAEADEKIEIRVVDSGPGAAPDILPRIFDPYFSTHETGTGLGLPITRRIVEEHGGRIVAQNRPGAGLEVVITLPSQAEEPAAVVS